MAPKIARPAMENQIRAILARGTQPQRLRTSVAQFVRAENGRKISLIGADSRPTAAGVFYYQQLGIEPPKRYAYDQKLLNDKWVEAFDGSKVKVREKLADGSWRITRAGMSYFKYNRTQYLPSVPFLVAKNLSRDGDGGYNGTVVPDARDNYMSVNFLPRDLVATAYRISQQSVECEAHASAVFLYTLQIHSR